MALFGVLNPALTQLVALATAADSTIMNGVDSTALNSVESPTESFQVLDLMERMMHASQHDIRSASSLLAHIVINFMANMILVLLFYFVGRWLLKHLLKLMDISLVQKSMDSSLRSFIRSGISTAYYILLIVMITQVLGVNTTSLLAMLASAGLAIGMALSGTLQNFAGGVMILILKPYRIGDYITTQGETGVVKDIMLFTTVLETTLDRKTIYIPNSAISSSVITNATFAATRRVDWNVGISYGASVTKAREVIKDILQQDERIIIDPSNPDTEMMVGITDLGNSSVNLTVRAWVRNEDYWSVKFDIYEYIYEQLPLHGIKFPFPQLDVHMRD